MSNQKYYIVSAEALPEVFVKVAEARRMLQVGEAATVGEAARMVGISRSAFYKYKDAVQPFQDMKAGHIITFYALLKDNPGVLSNFLSIFANSGAKYSHHQPDHPHQRLRRRHHLRRDPGHGGGSGVHDDPHLRRRGRAEVRGPGRLTPIISVYINMRG